MGKSGNKGGKRLTKNELLELLLNLFQNNPAETFPLKTIFRELRLNTHPLKMLCVDLLQDMVDESFLAQPESNKFRLKHADNVVEGLIKIDSKNRIRFQPDDGGEPLFILRSNLHHAMNGDRVRVALFARRKGCQGGCEVLEILERAKDTFVGKLQVENRFAFLICNDRKLGSDIFIPKEKLKGGKTGDKAIVRITDWPDEARTPFGEVIDLLGVSGDNNTEMHAILAQYGLPYEYPKQVEAAANRIPSEIPAEELARREDFRDVTTFTIDPRDAKDFDDALSIRRLENGLWEVGVHIADVTYYVKEGTAIDKEALNRATSVYLVDRTVPMLPERLCNMLCSLRQDEEKLAYSVIFHLNDQAEVKHSRIVHTVIKSNRRFVYEEVQDILDKMNGENTEPTETLEFAEELQTLDKMAKALRAKRFQNGAIDFDRYEVRFNIDEKGKPLSVYFKYSTDANKLVEEFMLLANRTVAETIGNVPKNKKAKTFVYRIHDLPDPDKLDNLKHFIGKFGYRLKADGSKTQVSKNINALLSSVKGKPEQNMVETVSLRAMQKAKYSTHNIGHYGLAFDYYTHFTSPIRRYPDMMVHRLLSRYLEAQGRTVQEAKYEDLCEHCSAMEQTAAAAERSSIKYKQVEFMQEYIGKEFDATISGITEWGLFAEINENKCEGIIHMRDLNDEFLIYDERNYCLINRKKEVLYSLGDPIRIKVARANLEQRQLDFVLAGTELYDDYHHSFRKTNTQSKKSRRQRK